MNLNNQIFTPRNAKKLEVHVWHRYVAKNVLILTDSGDTCFFAFRLLRNAATSFPISIGFSISSSKTKAASSLAWVLNMSAIASSGEASITAAPPVATYTHNFDNTISLSRTGVKSTNLTLFLLACKSHASHSKSFIANGGFFPQRNVCIVEECATWYTRPKVFVFKPLRFLPRPLLRDQHRILWLELHKVVHAPS